MKKYLKQAGTLFVIGLLILSGMSMMAPQKAYAILGVGDVVTDPGNTIQSTISAVANGVTSAATYYQQLKSSVFDAIATAIAKQLMMQITLSVVNWINTGFKGNPAFVQNPGKFFENAGDTIAGNFLADNSELAANLCSPFSVQVRVALALQISGNSGGLGGNRSQYSCSLSSMINNGANAIKGASINGFTSGDFRQGGWPAFLALTTVPANSPNGAFLQAQANISDKIGTQQSIQQTQLAQGNGFLSWTTCTPSPALALGEDYYPDADPYSDGSGQDCEVQTPGSTISNALTKSLNVPVENLELANDMNAIINALFSQLVTTVLGNGLTSVSKPNASGVSYIQQISNSSATQLQQLQNKITSSLAPDMKNETVIAQNADTALALATAAQTTLTNAAACYTAITTAASSTPYSAAIVYAQGQIGQIQQILTSTMGPIIANLTTADNNADGDLQSFNSLSAAVSSAQNVNDLGTTSEELQSLSESGNLPTAVDVLNSNNSLSTTESQITPIQADANDRLTACESFNPATYGEEGSLIPPTE